MRKECGCAECGCAILDVRNPRSRCQGCITYTRLRVRRRRSHRHWRSRTCLSKSPPPSWASGCAESGCATDSGRADHDCADRVREKRAGDRRVRSRRARCWRHGRRQRRRSNRIPRWLWNARAVAHHAGCPGGLVQAPSKAVAVAAMAGRVASADMALVRASQQGGGGSLQRLPRP